MPSRLSSCFRDESEFTLTKIRRSTAIFPPRGDAEATVDAVCGDFTDCRRRGDRLAQHMSPCGHHVPDLRPARAAVLGFAADYTVVGKSFQVAPRRDP